LLRFAILQYYLLKEKLNLILVRLFYELV
jgi:hypothetical protein